MNEYHTTVDYQIPISKGRKLLLTHVLKVLFYYFFYKEETKMINLLEEEYDAESGKYILHLTMGTEDTLNDLPSAEKPFNSSNYSCFFDYGEPAENSSAVDEESGEIYMYSNGEWVEPEPPVDAKIPVISMTSSLNIDGTPIAELNPAPDHGTEFFEYVDKTALLGNSSNKQAVYIVFYTVTDGVAGFTEDYVADTSASPLAIPDNTVAIYATFQ